MSRKEYRNMEGNSSSISVKISPELLSSISAHCKANEIQRSYYVRELIKKDLNSNNEIFSSGVNEIKYLPRENSFKWSIILDGYESGHEKKIEVGKDIELSFLENLRQQLESCLDDYYEKFSNKKEESAIIDLNMVNKFKS